MATRKPMKNRNFRPTATIEPMEPRQLLSGSGGTGFSVLSGINVDQGLHVPGHQFGASVTLVPWEGLDGLPVTLALSRDRMVGNGDDVILGTANATTTSWGPPLTSATIKFTSANFNVTLPASLPDGTYNVVASADDGSQTVGPSITVQTPASGKDLAFADASMFQWLWPTLRGRANATVRNVGTENTGPWTMAVYLSKDEILGNADDILVASGTPSNWGTGINPADTVYASLDFDLPSTDIPDGAYYPIVVLDPQDQMAETDETNNVFVARPIVRGPRTAGAGVQSVSVSSASVDPGSTLGVDLSAVLPPGVPTHDLQFELLGADGTAYPLGGVLTLPAGPTAGPSLATSAHVELSVPADLPAGRYELRIRVELSGDLLAVEVADRDPATVGPVVWVGMEPPAVHPAANPVAPPADDAAVAVAAGSDGQVPLVVSNPRKRAVRRTYNVSFYLSDDPTLSRHDRKFSRQQVATRVRAGRSEAMLASFQLPKGVRLGTHYLIAIADPANGASAEKALRTASGQRAHPGRVRLIVPIEVTRPQLKASVRSVKAAPGHPGMVRVKVRVANTGTTPFSDRVTFAVLSDDSDTLLTTGRRIKLEAGQHRNVTLTVRRPEAGGFRIKVS